jgi:hypothetical protein
MARLAVWNPRQISAQDVDRERCSHEYCANPEAPVTMHAPPVRTRIRLTGITTISFEVVLVSSHLFSITAEFFRGASLGFILRSDRDSST